MKTMIEPAQPSSIWARQNNDLAKERQTIEKQFKKKKHTSLIMKILAPT
jgi:hypothetical protein